MRAVFIVLLASASIAQTITASSATPSPDTQAAATVQKSVSAQFGNVSVTAVELSGSVATHFGKDDSGTVRLAATSTGSSKVTLNTSAGQHTETFTGRDQEPNCTWTDSLGTTHDSAIHNCWTDGAWFLPSLSATNAAVSNTAQFAYIGPSDTGDHLTRTRLQAKTNSKQTADATAFIQKLGTEHIYFDSTTSLPARLTYNIHPDDDANIDIPVEVRFSDYRDVNGVKIPYHIEKSVNGSLVMDIRIDSATINPSAAVQSGGAL